MLGLDANLASLGSCAALVCALGFWVEGFRVQGLGLRVPGRILQEKKGPSNPANAHNRRECHCALASLDNLHHCGRKRRAKL